MKFSEELMPRVENAIKNGEELCKSFASKSRQNVVLWLDLLGFQKQLIDDRQLALKRISVFHELTLQTVSSELHIAQLNDASVISMDFEDTDDVQKLINFLIKCDVLFELSTFADKRIGGYGTRGVISIGERQGLRGNYGGIAPDGNLSVDKIRFASPVSIMMNMAFAKSYLVESSGSLIKEPALYLEEELLNYDLVISPHWEDHQRISVNDNKYVLVRRDNE